MNTLAAQQQSLHAAVAFAASAENLLRVAPGREPLLRIYQHAYRARLIAALRDNFGVLPRAMGDAAFDALAWAYVQAHPSRQPSIRWLGEQLPEFMAQRPELVPHPALIDLARMEWALRSAFDAPDATPLRAEALAAVAADDWPALVLRFHPSLQLLTLQWQVEPAWRALHDAADHEPELDAPAATEHALLVWRPKLETRWRSAHSALEAQLLQAALAGQSFGALCELAAALLGEGQAAAAAVDALRQWVGEGLLV